MEELVLALNAFNTIARAAENLNTSYEELIEDLMAAREDEMDGLELVEKYSDLADASRKRLRAK